MGLFVDVNQQTVNVNNTTVIHRTKNGAVIICPDCKGLGTGEIIPGYCNSYGDSCIRCKGGGAIEVRVIK